MRASTVTGSEHTERARHVADLDSDGHADLAGSSRFDTVQISMNRWDGRPG